MAHPGLRGMVLVAATGLALTGCDGLRERLGGGASAEAPAAAAVAQVGRDIEAPSLYQTSDRALWDGRPSLGGIWVAAPDVKDPQRVVMKNPANGRSVVGALFRRERENPGPRLQLSSEAATALGLLAGQPATITVTALRRAETAAAPATPPAPTPAAPTPAPAAAAPAPAGALIQVGTYGSEANARSAAEKLTAAGVAASARPSRSGEREVWAVLAGPVPAAERAAALDRIKGLGFPDAYPLR